MSDKKLDEFNEKILQALMNKVKNSDVKIEELEKDLKVKEAELNYLAKLYDEKNSEFSIKFEISAHRISELEKGLENANQTVLTKENETNQLRKELNEINQVHKELNEINQLKKELIEINQLKKELSDLKNIISEKEKIIEQQNNDIKRYQNELRELKSHEIEILDTSSSLRLKCVKCGAVGKDIKTIEDKNKPISYIGNIPMYAKINVCKKCGYEF